MTAQGLCRAEHGRQNGPLGQGHVVELEGLGNLALVGNHDGSKEVPTQKAHIGKQCLHSRRVAVKVGTATHGDPEFLPKRGDIGFSPSDGGHFVDGDLTGRASLPRNMLGGAEATHLSGVQRTSAGAVHAEGTRGLTRAVQSLQLGLPASVHRHAAVAMLGADGDLQVLGVQVNAVVGVQLDGTHIHLLQPLQGRAEQSPRALQVGVGLGGQNREAVFQTLRVAGEIQVDPIAPLDLGGHQQIHLGGALHLAGVEGPLVALEEDESQGLLPQGVVQEFPLASPGIHRYVARKHLLVRARQVPTELGAGQTVLPLLHVGEGHPRVNGQARGAVLALGVHGVLVDPRRAACAKDHVLAGDDGACSRDGGHTSHARHGLVVVEDLDHPLKINDLNSLAEAGLFQGLGHVLGGQGAAGGGAGTGIVIRLVPRVLTELVGGEGHAQLHQPQKAAGRVGRLAEGMLTHDAAATVQGVRHFADAIPVRAAKGELVVGLLVAARVAGGAHVPPLGHNGDIRHAEIEELVGGVVARTARTDDEGVVSLFHSFLMCMPPSRMKDCPVVYPKVPSQRATTALAMSSG